MAFTVPGESFLSLLEVFDEAGIRVVAGRHEGGAGFMAAAYGQLTGKPAALLVSRAVGAANASIAIHTARSDSVPLFVLVGQVRREWLGREAFQEIDQVATLGGLAKWAAEPRQPSEVVQSLGIAVRRALGGRPGPVLLAFPEDLLDDEVAEDAVVVAVPPRPSPPTESEIERAVELLAAAERPVILAGAGVLVAHASGDLTRLAEALEVPVIASWRRGGVIDNDHRLYLGMTGYWAPTTVSARLERADAMLVLGCRLNDPTTFGYSIPRPDLPWVHVDLEPRPAGGSLPGPTLAIASDVGDFLRLANRRLLVGAAPDPDLRALRREADDADRIAWEASSRVDHTPWAGPGVHPGRVISTLRRVLGDDAILTTDAGNFAGWAARGYRFRRPGTFIGPTSGAMGYAVPAAIAAALVHPDRAVVAMAGDGGMAMTMAELETAVRERLRFVVLCFDNQRYGTIRMWQERRGKGQGVATELGPIDFGGVARGLGALGTRVESDADFEPALRQALAGDLPTVLQLVLDPRWVSVDAIPASVALPRSSAPISSVAPSRPCGPGH